MTLSMLTKDMLVSVYRDDAGNVYALGGGFRMLPKVKENA